MVGIGSLDDGLLAKCLGLLPLADRHVLCCPAAASTLVATSYRGGRVKTFRCCRSLCRASKAALVCQRWRAVTESPHLLNEIKLNLRSAAAALPRLRSLLRWLLKQAARGVLITKLSLRLEPEQQAPPWQVAAAAELVGLGNHCVAACSALDELCLTLRLPPPNIMFTPGCWVAAMCRLKKLDLRCNVGLALHATWEGMAALEDLTVLGGHGIYLGPATALPESLTSLVWGGDRVEQMPAQVGRNGVESRCFGLCFWARWHARPSLPSSTGSLTSALETWIGLLSLHSSAFMTADWQAHKPCHS